MAAGRVIQTLRAKATREPLVGYPYSRAFEVSERRVIWRFHPIDDDDDDNDSCLLVFYAV